MYPFFSLDVGLFVVGLVVADIVGLLLQHVLSLLYHVVHCLTYFPHFCHDVCLSGHLFFIAHNLLNLSICLFWVLMCLSSLLSSMNLWHSSRTLLSNSLSRLFIHVSIWQLNMVLLLFITLTLSFNNIFSAFLTI